MTILWLKMICLLALLELTLGRLDGWWWPGRGVSSTACVCDEDGLERNQPPFGVDTIEYSPLSL